MRFIESSDSGQGLPPFHMPGVKIRVCILHAELDALNAWCDRFLNLFDACRFEAAAPFVYVGINDYPRMYGSGAAEAAEEHVRQKEYYLSFPIRRHDLGRRNLYLPAQLSWAYPFIGVDNPTSAFTGREVLGFPKTLGIIRSDTLPDGQFTARVNMPSFKAGQGDELEREKEILRFETGRPDFDGPRLEHHFPWSLFGLETVAAWFDGAMEHLSEMIVPGLMTVTNLKQIRDGQEPTRAAWQGLVQCHYSLGNMQPIIHYPSASVTITDNATFPIRTTLGLGDGELKPVASFGQDADMVFDRVVNLCVA